MPEATAASPEVARAARLRARLRAEACWAAAGILGLAALAVLSFGSFDAAILPGLAPTLAAILTGVVAYLVFRLKQTEDAIDVIRRRLEEMEALAVALHAEIANNLGEATQLYRFETRAEILKKMRRRRDYVPFLVADAASLRVQEALLARLPLLPAEAVRRVVAYHAAETSVNAAVAVLRSEDFRALEPPRRHRFVQALFRLIVDTYLRGEARGRNLSRAARAVAALDAVARDARADLRRIDGH
jgi:hypothetical protein